MKILITEEQSKMLINHVISEEENIIDTEKVKKLINKEKTTNSKKKLNINKPKG